MTGARRVAIVPVDICCNHPDNGLFIGRAPSIHVGDIRLGCRTWDWSPKFTEGNGWIRIGGMKITCLGSKYGVGNWCWNRYACDGAEVERLINWSRFRKWFDIEEADEEIFNDFKAGKPLRIYGATKL